MDATRLVTGSQLRPRGIAQAWWSVGKALESP